MAIVPWFFGFIVLAIVVGYTGIQVLSTAFYIVQIVLYWMLLKWMVANLASNGQPLGLSFTGSVWAYIGWNLLFAISILTIIGWAWVAAAQLRWMCRNIQGTRRDILFKGSGLGILWREDRGRHPVQPDHPDPVGVPLDHELVRVADRARAARLDVSTTQMPQAR